MYNLNLDSIVKKLKDEFPDLIIELTNELLEYKILVKPHYLKLM